MDNMTALVSAFARAYHYKNNDTWVFADPFAENMLTDEEYTAISQNMSQGVSFFAPDFRGTPEEALRYIVDHQLAPPVLARSAFCERAIGNTVRIGCGQVVLYACGYDTFSLRNPRKGMIIYELDRPEMIRDRQRRINQAGLEHPCRVEYIGCDLSLSSWKEELINRGFDCSKPFFGSLLGISYYLSKEEWRRLIGSISSFACEGSAICFDYPLAKDGAENLRNRELAAAAGEPMKAKYSYNDMEALLSEEGFLIYDHMNADEATEAFFTDYNHRNPKHEMKALEGVGYLLAIKKTEGRLMKKYIAYCGLDCETCEAHIATVNNDNDLRIKVAREWSELNKVEISPEMINCAGCRINGVKTPFCDSLCPIRQCALSKDIETCGACSEMSSCEKLDLITGNNEEALKRLKG